VSKQLGMSSDVAMAATDVVLGSEVSSPAAAEQGILDECKRGDHRAFAQLMTMHEGMVYNLATRLLGDPEEAHDLAQEVFLQVYRTIGRFEGRSSVKTWIYRIVVNQCRNRQRFWRRRKKDRSCPIEDLGLADEARISARPGPEPGPFEQLERRERDQWVRAGLARLSFDHRAVLVLREVEGMSCDEIAAALGLPEGTVKSRLSRARESLRQFLCADEEVTERR
jgi:RNA polymerase sigma factor (sigma-70 family)